MNETTQETPKEAARRLSAPMLDKGFTPAALHEYTRHDGEVTHHRIRLKHPETGEKWIRPMRKNGHGYELAEPEFPNGKPLYRLHELASKPGAPCWYVEGENCADALEKLGLLATTAGGATSDDKSDFSPLAGRTVTIWPDNDRPGLEHAQRVAEKLRAIGCNAETLDAARLGLEEGGDCVDWLKAHEAATPADLGKLPRAPRRSKIADVEASKGAQAQAIYQRLSEIEAKPIHWLWEGRIARGKPTMIAGDPGLGKSQITASLAAIVTTGGQWPVDRSRCEKGSVLFLSAEDDPADTIRPRMEAAGADVSKVHVLRAVIDSYKPSGEEVHRAFNLKEDITRLEQALADIGDVALVIIDPISSYLGNGDSHNNAEMRSLLAPLAEMAARRDAAIVLVSHLNKGGAGGMALNRVTGSLAFVAAARAAFIVAKDPEDEERRLFIPAKNNIAKDIGGLAFRIEGCTIGAGIATSRIAWERAPVNGITADEILSRPNDPEERNALDDAKAWLLGMLADGPVASKQIMTEGKEAGHPERTLFRARRALNVEAVKDGVKGPWMLRLLPKAAKTPEDCQPKGMAALGRVGSLGDGQGEDDRPSDPGDEERF